MVSDALHIVILAGGAGTRLWPMSRAHKPKQFQHLVSERSMLQETYERVNFVPPKRIYVSTNAEYVELVKAQLPQVPEANIIAEPSRQDTGPCIGLAATFIAQSNPEAVMAVVYADHLVQDVDEFQNKLQVAAQLAAEQDSFNIIEVKAKAPNTNLGYVQIGDLLEKREDVEVYEFKAFHEKPDYETAKSFLESRNYLWNTGYYVWKARSILEAFAEHLPTTYKHLQHIQAGEPVNVHYPQCDRISVDYGIMEKLDPSRVRILPADLGWSDIGTWSSLHEELAPTPEANVTKGNIAALNCEGSLIYNEGSHKIAAFGIKDLVVVHADGYTLICPKDQSNQLKQLLKHLDETDSHSNHS